MKRQTLKKLGMVGLAIFAANFASPSAFSKATSPILPEAPQQVIDHLNSLRLHLSGVNGRPLPTGAVTKQSNGDVTVRDDEGRRYDVRSNGTLLSFSGDGEKINFNNRGKITLIHTLKIDVREQGGERVVVAQAPGFDTVVAVGKNSGYVERTFSRNKKSFVERTVVVRNPMTPFMSSVHGTTYTYTGDGARRLLSTSVADPLLASDALTALHAANERADALERGAAETILAQVEAYENR
jgi:hypothetical protein